MNRYSPRHKGIYQRCRADCPTDRCRSHPWSYSVELPTGAGGKRRQASKGGFDTAREAAAARAEVVRRHRDGELPADPKLTVQVWLPKWLSGRVERGELAASTARGYDDMIRLYLVPKLGHRRLGELRGLTITDAYREIMADRQAQIEQATARNREYAARAEQVNARRAARGRVRMAPAARVAVPRPVGPTTIRRIHACLSAALKAAVRQGFIASNPASNADLPKAAPRKVAPPTPEAYGAFLDAVEGDRLYPLWMLLGHSGLRRGEALGLLWEDLDLSTGRLAVSRQRVSVGYQVAERSTKTDAGQRTIFLDRDVLAALKGWRKTQLAERLAWGPAYTRSGHMFTREDGVPLHPDRVTKLFARAARQHGLGVTRIHALRHFRAAALISTGADTAAVSKTMGHASIGVTVDIYGSLFESAAQQLAETAAGYVPRRARTT